MQSHEEHDVAYAAGFISGFGSLMVASAGGKGAVKVVRYVAKSINRGEGIEKLAKILGKEVSLTDSNGKKATTLTVQGDELHSFMTALWPYLDRGRKVEYSDMRKKMRAIMAGYAEANMASLERKAERKEAAPKTGSPRGRGTKLRGRPDPDA